MRVVIAGSRHYTDVKLIEEAVRESGFLISEVVSGCARGIDTLAIEWAETNNIPVKRFPADANFALDGKLGGFARNGEMAAYADALIAIWDGVSPGTNNMIGQAKAAKIPYFLSVIAPPW